MVEVTIDYEGQLRCIAEHGPSGSRLATDAPVDNNGRGEAFSPTDLVATALGSCMATIMGIYAQRKSIDLGGLRIRVSKHMSSDAPRRIARLDVAISVPLPADHAERRALERCARQCPVHQSVHPDIDVPIDWTWQST